MAKSLQKIGPSQFTYFESCRLRFVLSKNNDSSNRITRSSFNRYTFLGVLIHEVIEKYYKGEFAIDAFEMFWESILDRMIDYYEFPPHVD